jgi:hypothetical protein
MYGNNFDNMFMTSFIQNVIAAMCITECGHPVTQKSWPCARQLFEHHP